MATIKIESFTNPITQDVLEQKNFSYSSGAPQVVTTLPSEIVQALTGLVEITNNIKNNLEGINELLLNFKSSMDGNFNSTNNYLNQIRNNTTNLVTRPLFESNIIQVIGLLVGIDSKLSNILNRL